MACVILVAIVLCEPSSPEFAPKITAPSLPELKRIFAPKVVALLESAVVFEPITVVEAALVVTPRLSKPALEPLPITTLLLDTPSIKAS